MPIPSLRNPHGSATAYLLYVADSPAQSKPMLAQLAREGIAADWFGTAEEALLAAAQRSYDLVLTDLNPGSGMGNAGLAKALRSMTPPGGDLPIVALTAWDSTAQGGDLFYHGIDDYVIKPVLEQALFFRIRRLIEHRRLLADRILTTQRLESEAAEHAEADGVAQAAMRCAREGSQRLMDSMSEGAYGVDNNGHCTFVNQAFLTMLGYDSASALLGKKIHAMIHHSHADGSPYPAAQCKVLNCRLNNRPISVSDEVFWTRSGKAIAVEYRANPVIREGEVVGVITTFLDITRRRAVEAHALRQEQLYACLSLCRHAIVHSTNQYQLFDQLCRIAVDSGGLSMAWVGQIKADTGMVKPVASWGDTSGYLDDILISISANSPFGRGPSGIAIREKEACWWQSFENFPTEPWRERLDLAGWACAAALPIFQNDVVVGVLALYSGVPCFFEEDAKSLLRAMVSDVSYALDNFARDEQRKCAELALQDSEYAARLAVEKTRSALEQLTLQKYALDQHAIVANVDLQGKITYANDRFCKISGYSRDELLGQDHVLLNSGEHPRGFFKAMYQTITAGKVWQGEICDRARDGQLFWVDTTIVPFMDSQGKPTQYIAIRSDVTERKANELELAHYRSHLEDLVREKTNDLALSVASTRRALGELEQQKFVLDQHTIVTMTQINGRITYCNDKFLEISGFTRDAVMGKDHLLVNSGHHPKGFFKAMYETIASGAVWHAEVCNRASDGHLYWVDTTVVAFMGEDGKPLEYIAVRTDITERKRALDAAHAANQAKSAFLSNMSHEIRTPMNGVIGMVDILKESKLDSDQRRMLDVIHNSSLALLNILNDILDYSKIEAGKLAIEQIPTHLREVAEGVTQLLFTTANDKAVELSVFVSPELPTWIASDPTRLRQILLNLLGNALKFTRTRAGRQGRVILRVTPYVYAFTDGRCGLRLSVSDNGIGMSREVQDTLFQPFTQGDRSTARRFGGTGLGLSISQRLVEMMNGRIVVRSTEGEGSEFTVELPLQTALPGRALAALPSLAGLRVLAVTTLPYDREIIPAYCHSAGAEVTLVADLAAARHEIQQSPSSDATVVLLGLAETAPTHELDLPVGVGVVRMGLRSKRLSATEQSLLVCPLLYKELIQGIALASGRLKASDFVDHSEHCALTRPTPPSIEQALASRRLILLAEDNETNREVMQTQLNILGYAVETAEDGVVALKMWQSGRYALLLTDCHMPRMNGFELTAAIREAEFAGAEGTHRPIIAVTANVMQGEAERCFAQGMDDYLAKPLRLNELGQMLGRWLPAPAVEGMASADGVMPAAASPRGGEGESMPIHCAIWDATVLTRMVGDNPAMHCRLLKKFLVNAGEQVRRIVAASATEDAVTVGDAAHPLKSSARTVGALQLGELGELLEAAAKAGEAAGYGALAKTLPAAYSLAAAQISKHLNDQP